MQISLLRRCFSGASLAAPVLTALTLAITLVVAPQPLSSQTSQTPQMPQTSQASQPPAVTASLPILGTWKLNPAKCDFGGGSTLRAMVLEYTSATAELIQFTATATYESGGLGTYSFKAPADGKDHPLTGSSSTYSYSLENGVLAETQKDSDGTVTKGTFTRSANGREGIWLYTITNPDATVIHQKLVFIKTA